MIVGALAVSTYRLKGETKAGLCVRLGSMIRYLPAAKDRGEQGLLTELSRRGETSDIETVAALMKIEVVESSDSINEATTTATRVSTTARSFGERTNNRCLLACL